jgi:hypothetical protein
MLQNYELFVILQRKAAKKLHLNAYSLTEAMMLIMMAIYSFFIGTPKINA